MLFTHKKTRNDEKAIILFFASYRSIYLFN